jgi:hypothetical protein
VPFAERFELFHRTHLVYFDDFEDEPRRAMGQVAHARFGAKDRGEYRQAVLRVSYLCCTSHHLAPSSAPVTIKRQSRCNRSNGPLFLANEVKLGLNEVNLNLFRLTFRKIELAATAEISGQVALAR